MIETAAASTKLPRAAAPTVSLDPTLGGAAKVVEPPLAVGDATQARGRNDEVQLGDELARALSKADEAATEQAPRTNLKLAVEEDLDRVVAQVVDSDSGDIIRQLPPEELVEMAKTLRALTGQIVDRTV